VTQKYLAQYLGELTHALDGVSADRFEEFVELLHSAYEQEHQIFLMGNGGSGATASHFVCDLNKGVTFGLPKRFRVFCLNDNVPTLMAYANDVSYEDIFVEPLKNFFRRGDLVIGVSGSGNSPNVLKAITYANDHGGHTVGFSGYDGGKLAGIVHTSMVIPVNDMQKCEDAHLILFHVTMQILCNKIRAK
jgi:D-sedoheptulose 7-phosphate isomerase